MLVGFLKTCFKTSCSPFFGWPICFVPSQHKRTNKITTTLQPSTRSPRSRHQTSPKVTCFKTWKRRTRGRRAGGLFLLGSWCCFVWSNSTPPKKNTHKNTPLKLGVCVPKLGFGSSRCVLSCSKWKMDGFYFQVTMDFIYFWIFFRCLEILAQKKKTPSLRNGGFFMVMNPMGSQSVQNGGECPQEILPKLLHKALPSNQVMPVTKRREP